MAGWTEEDIYLLAERAHSLYLQGRYEEPRIIFEGLVVIDPDNRYCRSALAALYMAQGEAQPAVQQLSFLLRRYPEDVEARARRCEAYLQLNRLQEAQEDWQALRKGPATPYIKRLQLRLQAALPGAGA